MILVVGLGNPGDEYNETRHNAGREALSYFVQSQKFPDLVSSSRYSSLISKGVCGAHEVMVVLPETFMNASGSSVRKVIEGENPQMVIVVYDDADLGLGTVRISYNRGSGGHNGVESIIQSISNREFVRVRIGISPVDPDGSLQKPKSGDPFDRFVLGYWKEYEKEIISKSFKHVEKILETIIQEGHVRAMDVYN